jgi:DUF1365 family protein
MHSAIYEGSVRHRRFGETPSEFCHGVAMAYVDLDELPGLLDGRLVARGPRLTRFRRSDYLGDPAVPLAAAARELVRERAGIQPAGPVRLLTHLRSFGHCFNPVSFYYCFDGDERVAAIIAEVTNTPWGERHAYVLARGEGGTVMRGRFDKAMHVSPFMGMDQAYEWSAPEPGPTLSVHIASRRGPELTFDATLNLRHRALTRRSLAGVTARYPAATVRMLALIYGHGIALKLRGAQVHPHPQATA